MEGAARSRGWIVLRAGTRLGRCAVDPSRGCGQGKRGRVRAASAARHRAQAPRRPRAGPCGLHGGITSVAAAGGRAGGSWAAPAWAAGCLEGWGVRPVV